MPIREELDLTNTELVSNWFREKTRYSNSRSRKLEEYTNDKYPVDFLLENLKIKTMLLKMLGKMMPKITIFRK